MVHRIHGARKWIQTQKFCYFQYICLFRLLYSERKMKRPFYVELMEFQKSSFFLVVRPLPPPSLSGPITKKRFFLWLIWVYLLYSEMKIERPYYKELIYLNLSSLTIFHSDNFIQNHWVEEKWDLNNFLCEENNYFFCYILFTLHTIN